MALLDSLEQLTLSGNVVLGRIPSEIYQMSNLIVLELEDCALTGTIATEIAQLRKLQALGLDHNSFFGAIPTELGTLTALTRLHVNENDIKGSIPTQIGALRRLTMFDVQGNGMTGSIPTELGQCSAMVYLYLAQNRLKGSLPTELGRLTKLNHLFLNENLLSGTIPTELQLLTKLEFLSLNGNNFVGSLDEIFCTGDGATTTTTPTTLVDGELWADCLGDIPEVFCSCCSYCCNAQLICEQVELPPESLPPNVNNNTVEFLELVDIIGPLVSNDLNVFLDPDTAQYKAMDWLANVDEYDVSNFPTQVMLERYALAVLYFETKGPTLWTSQVFFLGNSSVCEWQNTDNTGVSCDEQGIYVTTIDFGTLNFGAVLLLLKLHIW